MYSGSFSSSFQLTAQEIALTMLLSFFAVFLVTRFVMLIVALSLFVNYLIFVSVSSITREMIHMAPAFKSRLKPRTVIFPVAV
jgi:hypothetical protein